MTSPAKSVMLFSSVDAFAVDDGATSLALQLCELTAARLTAVLLDLQGSSPHPARPDPAHGAEVALAPFVSAIESAARQRAVDANVVTSLHHSFGVGGCLSDRLRLHDAGIIGVSRDGLMTERMLAEHLLFESGRPVILAPPHLERPLALGRIAIAWDNTRTAARALNDAVALFGTGAEYVLVSVGDDKDIASSLDRDEIHAALERRGVRVSLEQRNRGGEVIGNALQRAAIELGADVLAMGGFGRSRLKELLLGGATAQVLDTPWLPVLMSH